MSEAPQQIAHALFAAGNYDEAFPRLLKLADTGDGWAKVRLGWMYQQGLGLSVDLAKAETLYREAHQAQASEAPYYLGCLYRTTKRYREALRYLEEAASSNNPSAAYWAYVMHRKGEGIERNWERAIQLLQHAAGLGHIFAKRDLAKLRATGHFGLLNVPRGWWDFFANIFTTATIAAQDPEDLRLR